MAIPPMIPPQIHLYISTNQFDKATVEFNKMSGLDYKQLHQKLNGKDCIQLLTEKSSSSSDAQILLSKIKEKGALILNKNLEYLDTDSLDNAPSFLISKNIKTKSKTNLLEKKYSELEKKYQELESQYNLKVKELEELKNQKH